MWRRMSDPVSMGRWVRLPMRLHWFEDMDEDENRPYDMEEPNFFGLSIAYDPHMREVVQADRLYHLQRRWRMQYLRWAGPISRFPTLFAPLCFEIKNLNMTFIGSIIRLENHRI